MPGAKTNVFPLFLDADTVVADEANTAFVPTSSFISIDSSSEAVDLALSSEGVDVGTYVYFEMTDNSNASDLTFTDADDSAVSLTFDAVGDKAEVMLFDGGWRLIVNGIT